MPPPPDLSHHILPELVSKQIFQTQILPADLPATLTRHPTRARPLAVLIVGQTGAGKTRTAPAVLSAMNRINPPAHFIADVYKAHHPSYLTLISSPNPAHASPATGPDARKWLAMAAAEAISRKLDVLLESACRHPDDFRDLARMFGEAGYRVEVVVMAVPAALSRLGILHRFYERLPDAGSGNLPIRLTPVKIHDDSYAGLMSVAEWIDEVDYVDRVLVVRRGNMVAFSDDKTETGKLSGKVAEALRRERERHPTAEEKKIAVADLEKLEARDGKSAVEVKGLFEPLLRAEEQGYPELLPLEFPPSTRKDALLTLGEVVASVEGTWLPWYAGRFDAGPSSTQQAGPDVEGHELEVELGEVTPTFQKPPRKSVHVTQKGCLPYRARPLKLPRQAWSSRRTSSPTPLISKDNFVVTMRAKWRKKRVRRLKRKRRKMRARSLASPPQDVQLPPVLTRQHPETAGTMADANGRKRKRDGDAAAKSKKKQATEMPSKVTISSVSQAKFCPPVVASSPGIRISKNTSFTPYVKSDIQLSGRRKQKTPAVAQDLLLHSNTHQTMDYTAREDGNGDSEKSLKHYIGVFDPKTGKLEVVEAKKMVVRGTARAKQASDEAMTAPADYQSFYALKTDLGQTFGTRKAKKAIESVTLNAIDPNKGKAGASPRKSTAADKATLKQIGEITATMASKEELQDIVDQAKPVPRPNLEADAIQDVYDPDEFIGREVLAAVPVKDWIEPTKKGEDVQVYSRHVAARVKKIVDTGNVTKIRLLRYFYFLFLFYTMAQPGKQRGTKRVPPREKLKEKLAPAPQAVIEQIRRKFSDGGEIRKFHSDLLIAHCCALACIIDNFEVDTSKLREDMRLDQKDMNTYFYEIGARVKPVAGKEKGKQHHLAKLALPLQFPKLRSLAPKRR
ncbi:hypothetical protein GCG54_00006260 [Colletotrichum gloeosporioides]|uniref:60S ribosomal protein L41 n=1 Tax=Colletotrichum gloeosporioides TaxID=474922 RepID=A0A8H4CKG3_COLGL|nr:uncharacterized protein GCG54_00006260 [Colletotrichum gloeosporioides]KAF3805317.1 hypothetical protein GCG54_00006260 [Colletotrichum gloeosporioides]